MDRRLIFWLVLALPLAAQQYPDRQIHQETVESRASDPWNSVATTGNLAPVTNRHSRDAAVYAPELTVPDNARSRYAHGLEALKSDQPGVAELDFRKAIELFPKYASAYNGLGVALRRQGNTEGARDAYNHALQLDPNNAPADRNLAAIYMEEAKYEDAEKFQRRATNLQPHDPAGFVTLAYLELVLKNYDAALNASKNVEEKNWKKYPIIHMVRARAFEMEGKPDDALNEYKAYLKTHPDAAHQTVAHEAIARLREKKD